MSTLQFFFVFLFTGVMGLLVEGVPDLSLIAEHVFPLLYLGVGSSGIAYTLQILGQRSTNHALASVLMSLESVFGALGGALVLGEVMTPKEYLGCAVVFIAVLIAEVEIPIQKKQNAIEKTQ
jgi:drug/metabolite transporter (DMT)-like permease